MKLFQSLARQFGETRSQSMVHQLNHHLDRFRNAVRGAKRSPCFDRFASSAIASNSCKSLFQKASHSPLVLSVAIVSLTCALGHRFYNSPQLDIGRRAPQTIYAPATVEIEDPKATENKRRLARGEALLVLQLDQTATQQTKRQLQQQLEHEDQIRDMAGRFPYVKTAVLSLQVQAVLRRMSETEWQSVLQTVNPNSAMSMADDIDRLSVTSPTTRLVSESERKQAIAELTAYRRSANLGAFLGLIREIIDARTRYSTAAITLSHSVTPNLPHTFDLAVLDLPDAAWTQLRQAVPRIADRILAQGISPGLPDSVLLHAVELHLIDALPSSSRGLATQLLMAILSPNLVQDQEQTRLQAEKAAQDVRPVMVNIRRNEPIVLKDQIITSDDFALLEYFKLSRREVDVWGLVGFGTLVSGAVAIVWIIKQRFFPKLRRRDGVLLWLLSLSTPLLIVLQVPSTNLPVVGLLVSSFYGAPLGLTVTGLLTVLLAVGMDMNTSYLLSSAAGGLLCGWLGAHLRSREELAVLGVGVGVLQGALYLILVMASGTVWYTLLGVTAFQAVIGVAWVIIATGSSPYLEHLFDLVTTIRLVELANPNRPLLKRLAAEAPGTFQHTLFVATLAEAAARELGCNVELVRTGTLYHDIGKMHDPLGFIENQMGGPNKHDAIADPWHSAEIIKKHVSEGIVMARKARLPKAVQAFIPEHQGTMLIAYFYHQAQQQAVECGLARVDEADFRYDGPIPQSRETGIVMLADSCEAALRSLKDATPDEALTMVNKILRARWQDNQLINSGLTRTEMTRIAKIFVQVWQQFNHQRIAYPKLTPTPTPTLLK